MSREGNTDIHEFRYNSVSGTYAKHSRASLSYSAHSKIYHMVAHPQTATPDIHTTTDYNLYSDSLQLEFHPSFLLLRKSILVYFRLTGDWLKSVVGAPPPLMKADDSTEENQQTFI